MCVWDVGEMSGRVGWVFGLGWGDVGRVAGFVLFLLFIFRAGRGWGGRRGTWKEGGRGDETGGRMCWNWNWNWNWGGGAGKWWEGAGEEDIAGALS